MRIDQSFPATDSDTNPVFSNMFLVMLEGGERVLTETIS